MTGRQCFSCMASGLGGFLGIAGQSVEKHRQHEIGVFVQHKSQLPKVAAGVGRQCIGFFQRVAVQHQHEKVSFRGASPLFSPLKSTSKSFFRSISLGSKRVMGLDACCMAMPLALAQ